MIALEALAEYGKYKATITETNLKIDVKDHRSTRAIKSFTITDADVNREFTTKLVSQYCSIKSIYICMADTFVSIYLTLFFLLGFSILFQSLF